MSNQFGSDATKSAADLAKKIAQQIVNEPFEMGKAAVGQITGTEKPEVKPGEETPQTGVQEGKPIEEQQKEEAMKQKDSRTIVALEQEMKEIRERKKAKELEEKKKEEMEKEAENQKPQPFNEPSSKPSRQLFNFGKKPKAKTGQLQAERQKVHVEVPTGPSQ